MDGFSWPAVLVGGVAFFVLGAAWYSFLFRKPWAEDMGYADHVPDSPAAPSVGVMVTSLGVGLVIAAVIEWFVRDAGVGWGLKVGLAVGLAVAAVFVQNSLYDVRPKRLYAINAGYPLVGCVVVGIVCGAL